MFCSSLSGRGGDACRAILKALASVVPGESDNVQTAEFYEITASNAPCAYCEAAFHDNAEQAAWIIAHTQDIAEGICKGVCDYFGVPYVTEETVHRVQVGAFRVRENAENLRDELKEKGYDAFIVTA